MTSEPMVCFVGDFGKNIRGVDYNQEAVVTEGIVDSLSQALLEGRPSGSLLLTPQQLQQLQRFQVAQEQAGGALTLTLQQGGSGVAPQLVLAPQGFLTAGGGSAQPTTEHILHTSQQIGHTSIQHVLQSSISHVRQASILQSSLQMPSAGSELRNDKGVGSPVTSVGTPSSPFSPRSLTPSPSPTQRVVTPQPPVLQLFHQQATTRNAVQNSIATQAAIKAKQPPQILPKPTGSGGLTTTSTVTKAAQTVTPQQNSIPQQGTFLLNQMLPNGAVLVQQQTSSGVQLILKSPQTQPQPKPGLVLANGNLQPHVIVQGRTQAHQVLRFVPGQMQLQTIQTSNGPTIIAVPTTPQPPPRTTTPSQPTPLTLAQKKVKKKKKKEDEPTRLDLANLMKISGIDEDDVNPMVGQSQPTIVTKTTSTSPRPTTPKQQFHTIHQVQQQVQQQHVQPQIHKQINPSQLLAQLQNPAQVGGSLRLSVGEDGTAMLVHQPDQPVTPSIAAAAQNQLAQLIAEHGGQILQTNASLANNSKETAFMQSLQTAVLHLAGSGSEGFVLKGNQNQTPVVVNAAGAGGIRRPVVVTPTIQQNGVRLVADLNGHLQQSAASLTEHNRLIVSGISPAVLEQNRVQIVTGVPTSTVSLEQQNRLIVSTGTPNVLTQQGRVLVSAGSLEHQNRVQISTNSGVLTEQNRVIVSNNNVLDQNRLQILSNVPNNVSMEQNRVIVSGIQNSLEQQNRVIVSGMQSSLEQQNRMILGSQSGILEQNRVIMSGVQSSLDQQNRLVVSGVPSVLEQNRLIVSNMPNSNLSLSEKQNLVQIVNSNISMEEQNRVQIVTSLPNQENRLHFVSSPSSNILSEQKVYVSVASMSTPTSSYVSDVITFPGSDKIHFSQLHNNEKLQIVTSLPNTINIPDRKVIVSDRKGNYREDNVQVVSALVNDKDRNQTFKFQPYIKPEIKKDEEKIENEVRTEEKPSVIIPRNQFVQDKKQLQFNNRPNLTVVTQNSQNIQVNTITKVEAKAARRTYDNAFLDSIAQAHPNLVIKSPNVCPSKAIKAKKPMKKAALVKPMMAEDRTNEKDDPPNLVPINVTTENVPSVVSRVQTVQLSPLKQQQLRQIQAQAKALSSNKNRSPSEQAQLQRLISEQRKILLGGKLIPTVPGQHAQGVAFVNPSATPVRLLPVTTTASRVATSTQSDLPPPPTPPQPPHSSPPPPSPQPVITHANKATSPIPIQQIVSTQTILPTPSQPLFSKAKRASLIEQQWNADRQGALAPDTKSPFLSKSDAVKRLIRYHTMNEPVLSEKDLDKADEIFEQTAKHLLDKKTNMYNKFSFLILKESMRMQQTSELVLLERLFVNDETNRLEQSKQDATQVATTMTTTSTTTTCSTSTSTSPSPHKRERDDSDNIESKKHCPDDEEINAQVQSAIDSILNLQRNESMDEVSLKNS